MATALVPLGTAAISAASGGGGGAAPAPLGPTAFGDVGGISIGSKVVGKGSATTDQSHRTGDVPASQSSFGISSTTLAAIGAGLVLIIGLFFLIKPRRKTKRRK